MMSECRECDRSIPEGANFCPECGAPQNEQAARALESFTKRRIEELSPEELEELVDEDVTTQSKLADRLSYALGWATVVAGLAMLPSLASGFLLFGGIVILPPIRRLFERLAGEPPGVAPILALYLIGTGVGVGIFFLG